MAQGSDLQGAGAASPAAAPAPVAAGTMTLASILTIAGILLLFVVFAGGLVSLQHCFNAWDRRNGAHASPSGRRRRGRGTAAAGSTGNSGGGVDPELLRSLPVTVYRAAKEPSSEDDAAVECAVCLAELQDGEEARFLPRCGHGFHAECIDMWLSSHSTCPLCRLTVGKPPALALALPPVRPEPPIYAANLPAGVLLGVSDLRGAVTMTTDRGTRSPSAGAAAVMVIEIPESTAPTPSDVAKSPGSARLRSIRKLWSFGRQGEGPSSSRSCDGAGVEQSISVTIGIAVADMPLPSEAAFGETRPGAVV